MTKKQLKEKNKKNRVLVQFNTGERIFKSKKHPSRQDLKRELRKEL